MSQFNAKKYLDAQDASYDGYEQALGEIRRGRKLSHWIWYIFPQIRGLGRSSTAQYYALENLEEARQYLQNQLLREHLIEISEALLEQDERIESIVGYVDAMKVRSSMTLFLEADPDLVVCRKVLDKFYAGREDEKTLQIIRDQA
ncbi:MAG: DUF1810 domain-containing protein [Firmicutes bacterium]|nr:DUF1810 domain-containing protein [Bacillota bacterium]